MTSATHCGIPVRTCCESSQIGRSNMIWASHTPRMAPRNLGGEIGRHRVPAQTLGCCRGQCDERVHMGAGLRPKREDQRHQRATRDDRVREQRKADISAAKLLGHDPRPDHRNQQKRRRDQLDESFTDDWAAQRMAPRCRRERRHGVGSPAPTSRRWPISSTFCLTARRSRASNRKLVKSLIRVSSA
jgi:hypothetical protein